MRENLTSDKKENNIFEPSRGGRGIKLNNIKMIFRKIDKDKKIANKFPSAPIPEYIKNRGCTAGNNTLNKSMKTIAQIRFDKGPAPATTAGPNRDHFKL